MEHLRNLKIAVDFDGTIVEHQYPKIGKDMLFAFETLKELQKHGALLILWTFRAGQELDDAVEYCAKKGIEFYAVNKNYPEEIYDDTLSRKINADVFIDDKNVGGFPGWSSIWQELSLYDLREKEAEKLLNRRASFLKKIFKSRKDDI
ncbi:MAG: hydrolase [Marinilabiliaceae bacterium]|jgi:hypothetical protein|nr:hydrolase [Marinilabiliaceae bacterium]